MVFDQMARRFIACALLFAACSILLPGCGGDPPPAATAGVLDLRGWNFQTRGSMEIKGEWEFYDGVFLMPASGSHGRPSGYMHLPGFWAQQKIGGEPARPVGVATLRLLVRAPENARLALAMPRVYDAYRVFVNGRPVRTIGRLNVDPDRVQSGFITAMAPLFNERDQERVGSAANQIEIVLHVASNFPRGGGMRRTVQVGLADHIENEQFFRLSLDLFLFSTFVIMALYHFGLYFVRRQDASPLFFGLFCIGLAARLALTGEAFLIRLVPEFDREIATRILYVAPFMAAPSFIYLLQSLYRDLCRPWLVRAFGIGAALIILLVIVTKLSFYFEIATKLGSVLILAAVLYGTYVTSRAAIKKYVGARLFLSGQVVLFATITIDVLIVNSVLRAEFVSPYGLFIFIVSQSFMLSRRFSRALSNEERLAAEMERKNRRLLRLDQLKDDFLANTSHELRTPLNGIIGIVESLLRGATGPLSDGTKENLGLVVASGRRLSSMVNDILDFSKIRNDDLRLRPKAVDLNSAIEVALTVVRPLVRERPLDLIFNRTRLPPALADEDRLEQILLNLLSNAIKFTREGKITVTARELSGENDAPGMLEVEVADTGVGIPSEKQELVFEAFTQADGSVAREFGGTGLGLSITRRLVEMHGGAIRLASRPGEGSRFYFTLPVAPAPSVALNEGGQAAPRRTSIPPAVRPDGSAIQSAQAVRAEANGATGTEKPIRVLIVDDDPINLRALRNHLELGEYEVEEATNGKEALDLLAGRPLFDLILLDIMMPGISGYNVCRLVREKHSPTELPVIMLTAKSRPSDLATALELGANDYLVKPIEYQELEARVQNALALKRAASSQAQLAVIHGELELARQIQQSLIPASPPVVPGLRIAAHYRAMESVGGDFYDFCVRDGSVGAIMADVSGHGIPAALVVSMVHLAFGFQKRKLPEPDVLFANMNDILYGNTGNEYVTSCYAFVDPAGRRLLTSNAGHPPILVRKHGTGEIVQLRPMGRFFTLMKDGGYRCEELQLDSGDRILLYTDGLFETCSPDGEQFGNERLVRFVRDQSSLSETEFVAKLIDTIVRWAGGSDRLDDDVAVITIDVE
ncbi:MAG: SpoIIE family protein phosphatase [Spirochaetales bacterium]|nr:SpoIIE family protein phosphatase [Leptospiraceae bacterium]MCP5481347.1 SpoIIE family protein phosphatase [Spirochaetales bacterium]